MRLPDERYFELLVSKIMPLTNKGIIGIFYLSNESVKKTLGCVFAIKGKMLTFIDINLTVKRNNSDYIQRNNPA